jgi:hypothetical protein
LEEDDPPPFDDEGHLIYFTITRYGQVCSIDYAKREVDIALAGGELRTSADGFFRQKTVVECWPPAKGAPGDREHEPQSAGRPPLPPGRKRAEQLAAYAEKHGIEETANKFSVKEGTVERYLRRDRNRGQ